MSNFLGIKQVLFSEYSKVTQAEKLGYLWLVRNGEGSNSFDIYFGSRKYGSNDLSVISKLQDAFGGFMDENGDFIFPTGVNFTSFSDDVDDFGSILINLDKAIKANQTALTNVYTKTEVDNAINGVKTLLNDYAKNVTVTVGDATYTGTIENNVVNVDLSDAFAAAGSVKDVTVDGISVVDNNGVANISISGKADNSTVNALADRIASLEDFDHADDIVYDSDSKTIYLTADGNKLGVGFSATDFLVDGMLDNVEMEGNNLKFTFNTASGKDEVTVDFSKYIDTYHADDETIELNAETKTFSFKEANAEKINVNQIPVGGTPLADVLTAKGITSIDAGNLQSVLEALFSQNLWAENPRRVVPTALTVSMSSPSISFDKTGPVEVGTEVLLSASAKTASASATLSYEGFDYGYSATNDNVKDDDGNPGSVTITGVKNTDSNYKLAFTINSGFTGGNIETVNAQSTSGNSLIVVEGTNKVTVTASTPTFSATVDAQDAVYACSSLNKTDDDHVVAASEETTINGAVKNVTNNTSITGAYYAFVGFSDTLPTTSDEYRAFYNNGYSRLGKGNVTAGTCDKTYMAVCVPADWDFACNTSLGADMRNSFTESGDVTIILPNGDEKAYKYYALTYKDGAFKDLVIK